MDRLCGWWAARLEVALRELAKLRGDTEGARIGATWGGGSGGGLES